MYMCIRWTRMDWKHSGYCSADSVGRRQLSGTSNGLAFIPTILHSLPLPPSLPPTLPPSLIHVYMYMCIRWTWEAQWILFSRLCWQTSAKRHRKWPCIHSLLPSLPPIRPYLQLSTTFHHNRQGRTCLIVFNKLQSTTLIEEINNI